MQIKAKQIAEIVQGRIVGDPDTTVHGPGKIEDGQPGTITFLSNPKYKEYIYSTQSSIVLVGEDFIPEKPVTPTLIVVDNVYASLAVLLNRFNAALSIENGIASSAIIHSDVRLGDDVMIDDHVIIKSGAVIGHRSKIYGQVFIGDHVTIGEDVVLYPGVKIYHQCVIGNRCVIHANTVIGSDGFGFAKDANGDYIKIAQTGNVILEEDVEIGSNSVIDRASIGSTVISKGAKIDNLVQIAHNVQVGSRTVIAAQTGIAGSTKVGHDCIIGGQVGIIGHISIAEHTMIQAQSGVGASVKLPGTKLYGTPALDYTNYLKSYAHFKNLPELVKKWKQQNAGSEKDHN